MEKSPWSLIALINYVIRHSHGFYDIQKWIVLLYKYFILRNPKSYVTTLFYNL